MGKQQFPELNPIEYKQGQHGYLSEQSTDGGLGDVNFGSYDFGVNRGNIDKLEGIRAANQSTFSKFGNQVAKTIPAIGLGIIENAGYLGELLFDLDEKKDYSNAFTELAKQGREKLDEAFPVNREEREAVFDLDDPAWWLEHGGGLVESIGEFLVTGYGVGSGLSKIASGTAKALRANLITEKLLQGSAQVGTSAALAYTEGAMSGSEIYKQVYEEQLKIHGNKDTANRIASEAAATTVRVNTLINTGLNLTSISPLFRSKSFLKSNQGLNRLKGETKEAYLKRLQELPANNPNNALLKSLGIEALQEGLEEDVNLFAEGEGRIVGGLKEKEGSTLGRFFDAALTEEGALNFILGAIGGVGQTVGTQFIPINETTDEKGNKQYVSNSALNKANKSVGVANYIKRVAKDFETLDLLQKDLNEAATNNDEGKIKLLQEKLYDIGTLNSLRNGYGEAFIEDFEKIATTDNTIQSLQKDGRTEAMRKGYTTSIKDNDYKTKALNKAQELKQLTREYQELEDRFSDVNPIFAQEAFRKRLMAKSYATATEGIDTELANIRPKLESVYSLYERRVLELEGRRKGLVSAKKNLVDTSFEDLSQVLSSSKKETSKQRVINSINRELSLLEEEIKSEKEVYSNRPKLEDDLTYSELLKESNLYFDVVTPLEGQKAVYSEIGKEVGKDYRNLFTREGKDAFVKDFNKVIEKENKEIQKELEKIEAKKAKKEERVDRATAKQKVEQNKATKETKEVIETLTPETPVDNLLPPVEPEEETVSTFGKTKEQIAAIEAKKNSDPETDSSSLEADLSNQDPKLDTGLEGYQGKTNKQRDEEKEETAELLEQLNNTNEGLLVNAAPSIAYLAQAYEEDENGIRSITNEINPNANPDIFRPLGVKVGDVITISIDTENDIYKTYKDDIERVPIVIKKGDKVIGYVHTMDYIREDRVAPFVYDSEGNPIDNLQLQKDNLLKIRNTLFQAKNIESKITKKTLGILNRDYKGSRYNAADALPTISTFGIGKNGSLYVNKDDVYSNVLVNKSEMTTGSLYAVLPTPVEGSEMAIPLDIKKNSKEYAISMKAGLMLFLTQEEQLDESAKQILNELNEKFEINLRTFNGLAKFFNNFVYADGRLNNPDFLEELETNAELNDKRYLEIVGNGVIIAQTGKKPLSITKNTPEAQAETLLAALEEHLSGMFTHIDLNEIKNNRSKSLPIISVNTESGDYSLNEKTFNTYSDFIKEHSLSDVVAAPLSDNDVTYFVQPTLEFFVPQTGTTPTKEKVVLSTEDKKTGKVTLSSSLTTSKVTGNISAVVNEDLPETLGFNDILVNGYSSYTQNEVIDTINSYILSKIKEGGESVYAVEFTNFIKEISNTGLERFENIVKNQKDFRRLAQEKLQRLGILKKRRLTENEVDSAILSISELDIADNLQWEDEWVFKLDPKNTAGRQLKQFLAFIPDTIYNPETKEYLIKGTHLDIENVPKYIPLDEVWEGVLSTTADAAPVWSEVRKKLEENTINKPYLYTILQEIDNYQGEDKQRLINQFVVAASKTYNNYEFVNIKENQNNTMNFFLSDSNTGTLAKSIQHAWLQNLKQSKLVTLGEDGEPILNKKETDKILEKIKNSDKTLKTSLSILNDLGITVSPEIHNSIFKINKKKSLKAQFEDKDGLFFLVRQNLENVDNSLSLEANHPLKENSGFKALSRLEAKYSTGIHSNSLRNINNDLVYAYGLNKYLSSRTRELLTSNKAKELSQVSFNSTFYQDGKENIPLYENWLYSFENDTYFKGSFKISPIDGMRRGRRKGVSIVNMYQKDQEVFRLASYHNNWQGRKNKKLSKFVYTIPGKGTSYLITAPRHNSSLVIADTGIVTFNKSTANALFSVANAEYKRIRRFQELSDQGKAPTTQGYKDGASKFLFYDFLNKENSPEIWKGGRLLSYTSKVDYNGKETLVGSIIREKITTRFNEEIKEKIKHWKNIGIIGKDDKGNPKFNYVDSTFLNNEVVQETSKVDFNQQQVWMAADFIINSYLANFNMHQAFIGDPALFYTKNIDATWANIGKRLAKDIASGEDLALDNINEEFVRVYAEDKIVAALNLKDLQERLGEIAENYGKIEGTDAVELTTLKEHITVLYKQGRLATTTYNNLLDKIKKERNNLILNEKELGIILQPMKPVYSDSVVSSEEDLVRVEYIKSASFPLIPQLTKGLDLDNIRIALENLEESKNLPVRLAFKTATKLGGKQFATLFNSEGKVPAGLDLTPYSINVPRRGLRIQQDIPYDPEKDQILRGSQISKLLFDSILELENFNYEGKTITAKELKEKFLTINSNIAKDSLDKLHEEITTNGELDLTKLRRILQSEAIDRDYSVNDLLMLSLNRATGRFTMPFWSSPSSDKYESLLTSLYTNRVIKQKLTGRSLVLVSEEGFGGKSEGIVYSPNYDPTTGLKPMRIENGEVKPAQIIVPNRFKDNQGNLLDIKAYIDNTTGLLDINKVPQEMLEAIGFRIPTQGHNSMAYLEIVGFLPDIYKSTVIAPRNFIVQMGSDFDVDKLYIYEPEYENIEGNLIKIKNQNNELFDIHKVVLTNNEVFNRIIKPLEFGLLAGKEDIANKIEKARNKRLGGVKPLYGSQTYWTQKYLESLEGRSGIGIKSLDSTFNAVIQNTALKFKDTHYTSGYLVFGEDNNYAPIKLNELGRGLTWDNKRTINEVIAAYQSAAVDNEKNPILGRINSNSVTFPVERALAQVGFTEDFIAYFTSQDIIVEYAREVNNLRGTTADNNITEDNIYVSLRSKYINQLRKKKNKEDFEEAKTKDADYPLTRKDMLGAIEKGEEYKGKYVTYEEIQLLALEKFRKAELFGKALGKLQTVLNSDSAGLGKNLFEVADKVINIQKTVQNNKLVEAADTLLSSSFPISMNNIATQTGLFPAYKTFLSQEASLFPYEKRIVQLSFEEIEQTIDRELTTDSKKQIWNALKSYIFSLNNLGLFEDASKERGRLFFDTETSKSLATRINEFSNTPQGRTNPFIRRLSYDLSPLNSNKPSLISYNSAAGENLDEVPIYQGFKDLFRDTKTKQLGIDLIRYAYLNGGQQQAKEFTKYIPFEELVSLGFASGLDKVNFNNTALVETSTSELNKFSIQYLQHNPYLLKDIKESLLTKQGNNYILPNPYEVKGIVGDLTVEVVEGEEVFIEYPKMFRATDNTGKIKILTITKLLEDGSVLFTEISNLNEKFFNQYDANLPKDQFVVNLTTPQNNTTTTKKAILSTETKIPKAKTTPIVNKEVEIERKLLVGNQLSETVDNIIKTSSLESNKEIAQFIKDSGLISNWTIIEDKDLTTKGAAYTTPGKPGKIAYNTNYFKNSSDLKELEKLILHESVHAITVGSLLNPQNEAQRQAITSLTNLKNNIRTKVINGEVEGLSASELEEFEKLYAKRKVFPTVEKTERLAKLKPKYYAIADLGGTTTNETISEFITGILTEPETQRILNSIPYDGNKTILERFVEILNKILISLGVKPNSSLEKAINDILYLVENTEKDPTTLTKEELETVRNEDLGEAQKEEQEYKKVIEILKNRLSIIENAINKAKLNKDLVKVRQLEARKEELENDIKSIQSESLLSTVITVGKNELQRVRNILEKSNVSASDLDFVLRTLTSWEDASDFLLTDLEIEQGGKAVETVAALETEAKQLRRKWDSITKDYLFSVIKKESSASDLIKEEVLGAQTDISSFTSLLLDLSRTDNTILQIVDKFIRRANNSANAEAGIINKDVDLLIKNLNNKPEFKRDNYYVFAQEDKDGNLTGNLVSEYLQEYYDIRKSLLNKARRGKNSKFWKEYFDWKRDNHVIIDIRKLYKENTDGTLIFENNPAYITELEKEVGKVKAARELKRQQEKINNYNEDLTSKILSVEEDPDGFRIVEEWKIKNSPVYYMENLINNNYTKTKINGKFVKNEGYNYATEIPKQEWYDQKYATIQEDEDYKAFYDYTIDTLNNLYSYLPERYRKDIQINTLPSIPKSVMELYSEKGMSAALVGMQDWFKASISVEGIGGFDTRQQDPITNKPEQSLRINTLKDLTPEEKSFDLGKVIKVFSLDVLAYKHKSKVEDFIRLAKVTIEEAAEKQFNPTGIVKRNKYGEDINTEEGLTNLKKQLEYTIEAFYGDRKDKSQGLTKKKIYLSKEAKLKQELEQELLTVDDPKERTKIEARLENLGRNLTSSAVGDMLLQYIQVKGMGWNIFTGVTNVVYGWMSNMIWAAGGVEFNLNNFWKANKIMLNSTIKSTALDAYSNKIAQKVQALMQKFDVLKEINEAAYSGTINNNKAKKGIRKLAPYEIQRRSEYFAQGQTLVAMMLGQEIKDLKGNTRNLWEAYNEKGEWKVEEFGESKDYNGNFNNEEEQRGYLDFKDKLDQVIKSVHGNYDTTNSPVRAKKEWLGRALLQFRSWMAEGWSNRFEKIKYDELLQRKRKGRWRTYSDLGFRKSLASLYKVAVGKETNLEDVDKENIRKNLMELSQLLSLWGAYFFFKAMKADDDDDDVQLKISNFWLNQIIRLQNDINFYASPIAFENITRSALPVFGLVTDIARFNEAIVKSIADGDMEIPTGVNAGRNRVVWRAMRLFPFTTGVSRVVNTLEQEFK